MKKVLLSSLLACSLFAAEQNYIELGFGSMDSKDNFSTDSKESISSLGNAQSEKESIPYFEFLYAYELNENMKIYTASQFGEFRIGSEVESNYGLFDFGVKADLMGEAWKNPYQTGSAREKTDTQEFGVYLGYGLSFNAQHESMIKYEFSNKEYDKDDLTGDLKRDGKRHVLSFENMYHSSLFGKQTSYIGNLALENFDADGEANSYNKYGVEFGTSTAFNDDLRLTLLANFGKQDYEKHNTAVNQKVNVKIYGAKAVLKWSKPFDYKNTYVSLKSGYEKEEANTDFFDKENTFGILSFGYLF